MSARQIRRFHLEREVDVSGVSGTGAVAYGVQAPDGTCVLWWNSDHGSVAIYPSMQSLLAIHGHGGMTNAVYIDGPEAAGRAAALAPPEPGATELTDAVGATGATAHDAPRSSVGAPRARRVPAAARVGGGRGAVARGAGRNGRGRIAKPSWGATAGLIIGRAATRGGAARALPVQASGRKHGAVGPSGSMV
ncbi:hypothetical protein FrEUN1fDRAFT_1442 [Parafrankia sp. EUN1f]|nr:hypothetical protein FrEUN1fDRAFT_1442 [Parafrankia sp. EUN1f]